MNCQLEAPGMQDYPEAPGRVTRPEIGVAIACSEALLGESVTVYLKAQAGIRVVASCTSARAIRELLQSTRLDVLVIDMELLPERPEEFIRSVAEPRTGTSWVLLMAKEDGDVAAQAMRTGVSACVSKQAPIHDLIAAIRSVADGQMWMSPGLLTAMFRDQRSDPDRRVAWEMLDRLTARELEVLSLMVAGSSRSSIAEGLHLSGNTVRTHTQNIQKKLRVRSSVAAVSVALKAGLRPD